MKKFEMEKSEVVITHAMFEHGELSKKVILGPEMKAAITETVEDVIKRALQPGGLLHRK